jgi:L-rhamnose isomerase/sugar isomerase
MLGGFHFNDRKYADDDLTLGSIDPYQIFRIFHEIHTFAADRGKMPKIAYMVDQSHNEKAKVEAMIQTVVMAQELYAKAAIVDHDALRRAQATNKLPADPLAEHRRQGYEKKAAADRRARRKAMGITRGGSFA